MSTRSTCSADSSQGMKIQSRSGWGQGGMADTTPSLNWESSRRLPQVLRDGVWLVASLR